MNFSDYQKKSKATAFYPHEFALPYIALGLTGEAGEVAEKIKKIIRDQEGRVSEEHKKEIGKELGDVLWYMAQMATELGLDMSEIAQGNIDKLTSRRDRGVLGGSGDNR